jgi:hypothetical protein
MRSTPSRHTRLTSLVGALLTAAVAACLVAFSLVAQHAAQQTPEAPAVSPQLPGENSDDPIEIARAGQNRGGDQGDRPQRGIERAPTPSAEEQIDALVALADGSTQAVPEAPEEPPGPGEGLFERGPANREPPVSEAGPDNPTRCAGTRCRPDGRPTIASQPQRQPAGSPTYEGDCRGDGHSKQGSRHRGKGKGHCESYSGDERGGRGGSPGQSPEPGPRGQRGNDKTKPSPKPPAHGRGKPQAERDNESSKGPPPRARSTPPASKTKSAPRGHAKAKPTKPEHSSKAKPNPPGRAKAKPSPPGHAKPKKGHSKKHG